jgi:glycine cleavage system H lipoate-binding protein
MQAGVVMKKTCSMAYNCPECRFDRTMRRTADENKRLKQAGKRIKGKRNRIMSWKEKLRALPVQNRPCIHHMKGRIPFKACTNDYHCGNCDFDQFFYDQYSVNAVVSPVDFLEVKGIHIPQGYYLHAGHTWAKMEEGASVRVGIDDFALRLLGPLDRVEAPLMGKEVEQGRGDIAVFRSGRQARLLSPVNGVVTAINPELRERGNLANQDPYSGGWVMTVHAGDLRHDLRTLMIHNETRDFIGEQVDRLYGVIEETAGPLAADGGHLGPDIFGSMPRLGWERLIRVFLNPDHKEA